MLSSFNRDVQYGFHSFILRSSLQMGVLIQHSSLLAGYHFSSERSRAQYASAQKILRSGDGVK